MKNVAAFVAGLLFALGLGVAGMTRPSKVIGFLEVKSGWDPSLLFVMIGAIAVYSIGHRFVLKRSEPLFETRFFVPTAVDLDGRLLLGAAIFGIGWGLGGFCPGPGIAAAAAGGLPALAFSMAMLAGMALFTVFERRGCVVCAVPQK